MRPLYGDDESLAPTQLRELSAELLDRISTAVRDGVISAAPEAPAPPRRIVAERDGRMFFIAQADIDSIEASRNYVNIHANGETFTVRWTMQQAQATLEAGSFMRIHRSTIVNLHKVREMVRGLHGQYALTLGNGQCFTSGRAYRQAIQAYLKNDH